MANYLVLRSVIVRFVCSRETKAFFLLSCRLPADVDEVARHRRLAWGVGFEISKDLVLQFTMKGLSHQPRKALQTMRVVGETEFTAKDRA